MAEHYRDKLTRWLASMTIILALVTLQFYYLWFRVADEIYRAHKDYPLIEVQLEALAAPLITYIFIFPLTLIWHLGDLPESDYIGNSFTTRIFKYRFFLISLLFCVLAYSYSQAGYMQSLTCDHCGHKLTSAEVFIGIVALAQLPILCVLRIATGLVARIRSLERRA